MNDRDLDEQIEEFISQFSGDQSEKLRALFERRRTMNSDVTMPWAEMRKLMCEKWVPYIVAMLRTGPMRYAQLQKSSDLFTQQGEISQRILTLKLKSLESFGLLKRTDMGTVPPHVVYSLTPLGEDFALISHNLIAWTAKNRIELQEAKQSFEAAEE